MFRNAEESHAHSLETLNLLYEHDDFMGSIKTLVDLGCGAGLDLEWWATRTTREDKPEPLNIRCTGIDMAENLPMTKKYNNLFYRKEDFENLATLIPQGIDVLWCHNSFQYVRDPIKTLSNWWHMTSAGGMLYIAVPVTQRIYRNQIAYHLDSGCYYHHTMVSLIYMLATAGWDCRLGFFKQLPHDPWIHAAVYKSEHSPMDPKNVSWHSLVERKLLPESAERSIFSHNFLRQQDLVIPWLDHSLLSMAIQ